ncbi:predicted protein [Mycobacterium tuberculosis T85]|nr:predicted protein [Mycobacterium tuberculosis T85]
MKRLDLVAGPNGAGKSTFVALTLAPLLPGIVFVNADEIAKQRWPDDPTSHAYQAAQVAADTRARLIDLGRPFIAETVFSHPSKLELIRTARTAGYTVVLHVLVIPEGPGGRARQASRRRGRPRCAGDQDPRASPPAGRACRPGHHAGRRRHRL